LPRVKGRSAWAHERFFLYPTFDHQPRGSRARVPPAGACAAPSRRASGAMASRRCTPSSPARRCSKPDRRADPRVGRSHRPLHGRRPPLHRRAVALLRVDAGLRSEAPRLARTPSAARVAPAHVPHPAPGDGEGQGRVQPGRTPGSSCSANFRSRGRRCSPTRSSSGASEEIRSITADRRRSAGFSSSRARRRALRAPA